jgi:hypothetical protein
MKRGTAAVSALALISSLGLLAPGSSARAADLPPTMELFSKLTPEQMKKLPDVKVALGKAIEPGTLEGKSETELTLMRNSIHAQLGIHFWAKPLAAYFQTRSWYKDGGYKADKLSELDRANARLIQARLDEKFHPIVAEARKGRTPAGDKEDHELAKKLMLLGYCVMDYGTVGKGLFVFGKNFRLTFQKFGYKWNAEENSVFDEPYAGAYGLDSESIKEVPTDTQVGTWNVMAGAVYYNVADHGTKQMKITKKTWTKRECGRIAD